MKLLLIFTCICAAFVAAEDFDFGDDFKISDEHTLKILKIAHECTKELKVDYKEVLLLAANSLSHPAENIKCYINCVLEKLGIIRDGDIDEHVLMEKLHTVISNKDKVNAFVGNCHNIKGSSHCDIAYNLFECLYKHKKDLKS